MTVHLERREQDARGNILPWVAESRIGRLGSSDAHRIYLSGPMQMGWIEETSLNVRSQRRCPSHENARNRVSGWGFSQIDRCAQLVLFLLRLALVLTLPLCDILVSVRIAKLKRR